MDVKEAAHFLEQGGLVALPTETVYGLAADAQNAKALERIYHIKGRPVGHPLIVHIADKTSIDYWARDISDEARVLIDAFWPGPLTLILKKTDKVPDMVTGGQDSVGIRCPEHPVAQQLLTALAELKPDGHAGVAAPSANKFGQISPSQAHHVHQEFAQEIAAGEIKVLEGGSSSVGIESTIVDVSRIHQGIKARLLRPGHISREDLATVLGYTPLNADGSAPKASGTLKAHYAPRTPFFWLSESMIRDFASFVQTVPEDERWIALVFDAEIASSTHLHVRQLPINASTMAQQLYTLLREIDEQGYHKIFIQKPPAGIVWEGVRDRLSRAVAAFE